MKQINTFSLYQLGDALAALGSVNENSDKSDAMMKLLGAYLALDGFLEEIVNLGVSIDAARKLQLSINGAIEFFRAEGEPTLAQRLGLYGLNSPLRAFSTVLGAELQRLEAIS